MAAATTSTDGSPAAPRGWLGRLATGAAGRVAAARTPAAISAVVTGLMALAWLGWIGLARFNLGRAGSFDLGIFAQSAKAWSSGQWPSSSIRNAPNLFADHFSPITALFGVAWRVSPDPRALIITQALALALAVAVMAHAWWRLTPWWLAVPAVAALITGKQVVSAAFFDVHEVGLGVPLMAGLCLALRSGNRRLLWPCALGLLLVKEDLGLTVAMAGLVWWWRTRQARPSLLLIATGLVGVAAAFGVIFAVSGQGSVYLASLAGEAGNPLGLTGGVDGSGSRWAPTLLFTLSAGVIGLASPIAALALPTLAWRFVSDNTAYWQTYFHYDLMLAPIASVALLDVATRLTGSSTPRQAVRVAAGGVAAAALAFASFSGFAKAFTLPLADAPLRPAPPLRAAGKLAAAIPPGSTVAVSQGLGPGLVPNLDVHLLNTGWPVATRWVLLAPGGSEFGAPQESKAAWLAGLPGGARVSGRDGVILVDLGTPNNVVLPPPRR